MNNEKTSSANNKIKKEIKKQNESYSRNSFLQFSKKKKKKTNKKKSSNTVKEPQPITKETKDEETQTEEKVTVNVETNTSEIERKDEAINTDLETAVAATYTEPETVERSVETLPETAEATTNTEPLQSEIIQPIRKNKKVKRSNAVPYNIYKHPKPFNLYVNKYNNNTTPLTTATKSKSLTRIKKRKNQKYPHKLSDALNFSRTSNNNSITSHKTEDDNIVYSPAENNDSDDNVDEVSYTVINIR